MAIRTIILRSIIGLLLGTLGSCTLPIQGADPSRPTVRPLLRITPAPPQDVKGTATAFALRIVPTPTPIGLYIVKPGDSLGKIAEEFATTVEEIMALNNISDPNQIEVGRELTIPSLLAPTPTTDQPPVTTAEAPVLTTADPINTAAPAPAPAPSALPDPQTTATP